MEDPLRRWGHELNLASRKAEEAALRRFQAVHWLDFLVGPLGISSCPSEREFISCLRNGRILCNAINKIQPGSVPKVVENPSYSETLAWDSQPLPAYQYFENVRNFLVAVEALKLPAFEASDIERENLEAGSAAKVVDCILALKAFYEWKQMGGGNGSFKPPRSPLLTDSVGRIHSRASGAISSEACRRLDMSTCDKKTPTGNENQKLEDLIVKALSDLTIDAKENIDDNLFASFQGGNRDPVNSVRRILSNCSEEELQQKLPEVQRKCLTTLSFCIHKQLVSIFKDPSRNKRSTSPSQSKFPPLGNLSTNGNHKCCRACSQKDNCNHWHVFQMQEKELSNLKVLLSRTKMDFEELQSQLQSDLKQLGSQVQELSTADLGYHEVVKENRTLYNMVQDLKGNIRVYCRIRPAFSAESKTVIDFIGDNGSLVISDPLKSQKDGKKVFQFNRVFGPTATQDDVFRDAQPLIRSVMDGYNVCIFAYGQTGSGKTHTMSGPSGGLTKELGINYLALDDLFQLSDERKNIIKYDIYMQMVEIYNEQIRDLLVEDSSVTKLEIRSHASENGMSLPGATMLSVKSTTDVLNLMKLGEVNRAVSSTAINNRSSRSHSILTVHVHGKEVSGSILRSCLHLVDLAGSERVEKSEVTGDRLKEAQYINKSLSCLGDVIAALAQKNSHIPYRNSKLTLLLQNSLGGRAKTLMFAHVSPEEYSFGETTSTLKFAQRVSSVELGVARLNKERSEIMELKEQVKNLKKALANKEGHDLQVRKPKEARTPFDKYKAMADKTPPRSQRLSIENGSTVKREKTTDFEEKKASKTPAQTRAQRSLEASRLSDKDPLPINMSESTAKPLQLKAESLWKSAQLQDAAGITKPSRHISNSDCMTDVNSQVSPQYPLSSARKSQLVKPDSRVRVSLQLPKTPESSKNELQMGLQSAFEHQTPGLANSTSGKKSQIKRSLRTIGKLINGSEKRNQQKQTEAQIPFKGTTIPDVKSPVPTNGRTPRRQSLTGLQASERSRRSSLGGNASESCANESRNAKTPPPVSGSAKVIKRWL